MPAAWTAYRSGSGITLHKMFSAKGWRTREPASEDIAPERPVLASIGQSLSARGLSPEEIASIAGFSEPSHNSLFLHAGLRAV